MSVEVLDYDKLKKERISGTKIAPYHMITAITQRSINSELARMHKVNPSLQKLDLKSADPDDDYSGLEADLNAPTIELRLDTENRIVIFCINIERATLKYLKIKGTTTVSKETLELPSCVLALSVNLTFEGVDFKNLPKEVQDRLKVENDYSVKQLLVQFTSGSLARLDRQRTTIQDHITDVKARSSFDDFINIYFAKLEEKNDYILHYLPLATTEGRKTYAMPTVAPTDLTFENLPFLVSNTDNGKASDDNMLIYLQMTGNEPIPRELLRVPTNWVVPTPDNTDRYDGTVALSRDIFLAGWLLPKLAEFNKQSSYVATDAWWKTAPGTVEIGHLFGFDGHLGRDDAKEEEVVFQPLEAGTTPPGILPALLPTPGRWYKYKFESSKIDNHGLGVYIVGISGTTENYLFIPEGYNKDGKCEIQLFGTTGIAFFAVLSDTSKGSLTARWSTSIILDGINDGELIIKVGDITPKLDEDITPGWLSNPSVAAVVSNAKDALNKLSMTYLLNDMRSVLTGRWQFILPGAGNFYINKAVFNREEDLLCELKYKFEA